MVKVKQCFEQPSPKMLFRTLTYILRVDWNNVILVVKYIYNLIARASYHYIISGLSNLLFSQYAAHENCIITLTLYPVLVIKGC